MKCETCGKPATVHLTEISGGKKIEKHLCETCAAATEGVPMKSHTPINELLTNFVLAHSGAPKEQAETCSHCGIGWSEFKQAGVFGCEHDYSAFEKDLTPLLQRAHEGATHHVGKVPTRRGGTNVPAKRVPDGDKLQKELKLAIKNEDYEKAAKLRDQIRKLEG